MTVQAVVAGVHFRAGEPLPKWAELGVEDLVPGLVPGDPLGFASPERHRIAHRGAIGLRVRCGVGHDTLLPWFVAALCRWGRPPANTDYSQDGLARDLDEWFLRA